MSAKLLLSIGKDVQYKVGCLIRNVIRLRCFRPVIYSMDNTGGFTSVQVKDRHVYYRHR